MATYVNPVMAFLQGYRGGEGIRERRAERERRAILREREDTLWDQQQDEYRRQRRVETLGGLAREISGMITDETGRPDWSRAQEFIDTPEVQRFVRLASQDAMGRPVRRVKLGQHPQDPDVGLPVVEFEDGTEDVLTDGEGDDAPVLTLTKDNFAPVVLGAMARYAPDTYESIMTAMQERSAGERKVTAFDALTAQPRGLSTASAAPRSGAAPVAAGPTPPPLGAPGSELYAATSPQGTAPSAPPPPTLEAGAATTTPLSRASEPTPEPQPLPRRRGTGARLDGAFDPLEARHNRPDGRGADPAVTWVEETPRQAARGARGGAAGGLTAATAASPPTPVAPPEDAVRDAPPAAAPTAPVPETQPSEPQSRRERLTPRQANEAVAQVEQRVGKKIPSGARSAVRELVRNGDIELTDAVELFKAPDVEWKTVGKTLVGIRDDAIVATFRPEGVGTAAGASADPPPPIGSEKYFDDYRKFKDDVIKLHDDLSPVEKRLFVQRMDTAVQRLGLDIYYPGTTAALIQMNSDVRRYIDKTGIGPFEDSPSAYTDGSAFILSRARGVEPTDEDVLARTNEEIISPLEHTARTVREQTGVTINEQEAVGAVINASTGLGVPVRFASTAMMAMMRNAPREVVRYGPRELAQAIADAYARQSRGN